MSWFLRKTSGATAALPILIVLVFAIVVTTAIWFLNSEDIARPRPTYSAAAASFFATQFPVADSFRSELTQLRADSRLTPENEAQINAAVRASSKTLNIPAAVLWCLLFQESRLNHLEGINGDKGASGIGQFSYFSFYEVNHHLDRYTPANLSLFLNYLGRDVRPIQPKKDEPNHPSSYYYIPTAITATAAYLNNIYLHLQSLIEKRSYSYDPNLLWIYSAIAYNKGTRSVLSLLNDAYRAGGDAKVTKLLTSRADLEDELKARGYLEHALKRIWPPTEAVAYAHELQIHANNFIACSVDAQSRLSDSQRSH